MASVMTMRSGNPALTADTFAKYLLSFVLGFFGVSVPLIHSSGTFGILFSVFVVAILALASDQTHDGPQVEAAGVTES